MKALSLFLSICGLVTLSPTTCTAKPRRNKPLVEVERQEEYRLRNYTWPPTIIPDTEGWKKLMTRRFDQIQRIPPNGAGRYDGWVQTVGAAYATPNFTENGWGLTRAPEELVEALRKGIRDGLPNARKEHVVDVIEGETPLFIDRPDLTQRVLTELQPMHEAWSGMKLMPYIAYGFRLYRNQSNLLMHIDKSQTHVISCILHIDSSDDADPWPIIIEDLQGNTNEVILKSGDMLFYESSKCLHGRPRRFNGSWYSSIFVHYYPKGEWSKQEHDLERHYAIPPMWNAPVPEPKPDDPERLVMLGTSMKEPDCVDNWCALANAVKWEGPAEKDWVLTTGGKRFPLWPTSLDEEEKKEEL